MRSHRLETVFWGILFGAVAIVMLVDRMTPRPGAIDDLSAERRASIAPISEDARRSFVIEVLDAVDGGRVADARLSVSWPSRPPGIIPLANGAATLDFPWAAEGRAEIAISAPGYRDLRRSIAAEDLRSGDRHAVRLFRKRDVLTLKCDIEPPDGIRIGAARYYVVPPLAREGDWWDAAFDGEAHVERASGRTIRVTAEGLCVTGGVLLSIAAEGARPGGAPESIVARFEIERVGEAFSIWAPFRAERYSVRPEGGVVRLEQPDFPPAQVEGAVVDHAGLPIEGVTVDFHEMLRAKSAIFAQRGFGRTALDRAAVVTDRFGRFAFSYDIAGIDRSSDSGPAGRIDLWRGPTSGNAAIRLIGQKVAWGRRNHHVVPLAGGDNSVAGENDDEGLDIRR